MHLMASLLAEATHLRTALGRESADPFFAVRGSPQSRMKISAYRFQSCSYRFSRQRLSFAGRFNHHYHESLLGRLSTFLATRGRPHEQRPEHGKASAYNAQGRFDHGPVDDGGADVCGSEWSD